MIELETIQLDVPAVVSAFGRRLHEHGVPVTPERSARFAEALALTRPIARRRLYWTARAVLVSERGQVKAFDDVFYEVFGHQVYTPDVDDPAHAPSPPDERPSSHGRSGGEGAPGGGSSASRGEQPAESEVAMPITASQEEVLRSKRFDALAPGELAALYALMSRLRIATPQRRTRRDQRARRGEHLDVRRTLRSSLRTGGEPVRLAYQRRRVQPRRLVLLCDISGSMEPYARAYLQFLTCAGKRAEAFVFATRLTRVTRALATRSPERAIQRAAAAAPDWSSGTRIGEALRAFNDRHGRRGMARGAVIVILSDGWERGDPALVGREMERLARLAHRIVWVNPRVSAAGFVPRAGGMVAALPYIDALISGHSLDALHQVVDAIGGLDVPPPAPGEEEEDEWASATPVEGSSVAIPMGNTPSREPKTPWWGI